MSFNSRMRRARRAEAASRHDAEHAALFSGTHDTPAPAAATSTDTGTHADGCKDGRDSNTSPEAKAIDDRNARRMELQREIDDKLHPGEDPIAKFKRVFDGS
jgi:hypothetical protein